MKKLAAVIVETRPDKLIQAYENHKAFLPEGTNIYVFGDEVTRQFLDFNCLFITLKGQVNAHVYNQMLTNPEFWLTFEEDFILIFQHDSGLLREGLNEFVNLNYDFIGAPLYHIPFPAMNGGLSLRKKSAMLKVIEKSTYEPNMHGNEDMYFSLQMGNRWPDFHLPNKEMAMKFSCETIYGLGSLGYHAIDKYLTPGQCKMIMHQYD